MINPKAREWTWVARNLRIRSSLMMGSPANNLACPKGLTVTDIGNIGLAVQATRILPVGCRAVMGAVTGTAEDVGATEIVKLEWTWSSAHVSEATFDMVLRVLQTRMLAGKSMLPGAELPDGPVTDSPGAGGARPPALPARGAKRPAPTADPVVPAGASVRVLQHRKTTAKFERHVALAATALMDEERRSGVVRPPFTIGQVKPFSAWPFGGVVIYAQFPFLLDNSWRDAGKWSTLCQKVLSYDVGGRYAITFAPKVSRAAVASTKAGANDDTGDTNGDAVLPTPVPSAGAGLLINTGAGVSTAAAAGAATTREAASGARASAVAGSGAVPLASGAAASGAAASAAAAAAARAVTPASGAAAAAASAVPPASVAAASVTASAATGAVPPTSAVPGTSGSPAGASAAAGAVQPPGALAASGAAVDTRRGGAADDTPVRSATTRPALLSPSEPPEYVPLSGELQYRFQQALLTGSVVGGPAGDESIEWAVLERSAPTEFAMTCSFSCNLELETRSRIRPSGSQRSNNFITAAYPAKDPSETDVADLD